MSKNQPATVNYSSGIIYQTKTIYYISIAI